MAAAAWFLRGAVVPGVSKATVQKSDDGYRLLVDGKPYVVRGVCYSPVPVGKDYEFNFWGDPGKPWLTDGKLTTRGDTREKVFVRNVVVCFCRNARFAGLQQ